MTCGRHAGPHVHGLGGVLLGDLELLAGHFLQADRLVVHHVGVGLHALEDEVRIERHLAVEQRLADHVGGERPGLLDHLEGLAGLGQLLPDLHLGADGGEEIGDVLGEHVGVERRLLRHADLLPQRAVVGDHRLAEDRLQAIEILDVVVGLGDQHALEVLGLGQQHDALVRHVDGDHAAIALRHRHQDCQGVVGALEEGGELEPDGGFFTQLMDVGNRCGHLDGLRRLSLGRLQLSSTHTRDARRRKPPARASSQPFPRINALAELKDSRSLVM